MTVTTMMVGNDHAIPIEPAGGTATVTVLTGATIYYADTSTVTATINQGTVALGASQAFTSPVWIRSASLSSVSVDVVAKFDDVVLGSDGLVGGPGGTGLTGSVVTGSGTPTPGQVPVFTGTGNATAPGTASSAPSGAAGGVLSGTYPNPGMAAGAAATNVGTVAGDLSGTLPNPTVAKLGGVAAASYATLTGAQTLTNKRVTNRVVTVTQSATPTINTDNADVASITALAQAITSMTTNLSGTPVDGDELLIRITDNGTARAISWGASFEASTVALPTTTVISAMLAVFFIWNTATSKWRVAGVA